MLFQIKSKQNRRRYIYYFVNKGRNVFTIMKSKFATNSFCPVDVNAIIIYPLQEAAA